MSDCTFAFLHGGGQGGWVWDELIAALQLQSQEHTCTSIALDVPGCGAKRSRDTSQLTVDDIASELVDNISAAGVKDVVLVGHSQAGTILPRMVEMRPQLFRRLVYVTCSCPLPGQNILQMMGRGRQGVSKDEIGWPFDSETEDVTAHYPALFCNDMDASATAAFMAKLGDDAWPPQSYAASEWRFDHLGAVPATYVVCLKDQVLPVVWQERFAERFKAERVVRIDAGHQLMNTRPHTLAEVLRHEALDERSSAA